MLVCKNIYKTNEQAEMILENNNEIALAEKQDKANQETTNIYRLFSHHPDPFFVMVRIFKLGLITLSYHFHLFYFTLV